MKINMTTFKTSVQSAKKFLVDSYNDAKEINQENNVFKDVKNLISDIKEATTSGKVYTAGVTDESAKYVVDTTRDGLEAYAKANKLNIIFHTPQKPYEVGSNTFEKPLTVTVTSQGLFNSNIGVRTIDGDTNKITTAIKNNTVKIGNKEHSTQSTYEETFTKRVFRTVTELKNEIRKK